MINHHAYHARRRCGVGEIFGNNERNTVPAMQSPDISYYCPRNHPCAGQSCTYTGSWIHTLVLFPPLFYFILFLVARPAFYATSLMDEEVQNDWKNKGHMAFRVKRKKRACTFSSFGPSTLDAAETCMRVLGANLIHDRYFSTSTQGYVPCCLGHPAVSRRARPPAPLWTARGACHGALPCDTHACVRECMHTDSLMVPWSFNSSSDVTSDEI
jgi:hypothetical protein